MALNFGVREPQLSPSLQIPLPQLPQGPGQLAPNPGLAPPGGGPGGGAPPGSVPFADLSQVPPEQPQPPGSPEELEQRTSGWEKFLEVMSNPAVTQSLLVGAAEIFRPRAPGTSDATRITSGLATGGQQFLQQSAANQERERRQQATTAQVGLAGSQAGLADASAELRTAQAGVIEKDSETNAKAVEAAIKQAEASGQNAVANMLRATNEQSLVAARIALFEAQTADALSSAANRGKPAAGSQQALIDKVALSLVRTGLAKNKDTAQLLAVQFVKFNVRSRTKAEFELEAREWANDAKALMGTGPEFQAQKDAIDAQVQPLIDSFALQTSGLDVASTNVPASQLNAEPPPNVDKLGRPMLTQANANKVKTQPDGIRWKVTLNPETGVYEWEKLGP